MPAQESGQQAKREAASHPDPGTPPPHVAAQQGHRLVPAGTRQLGLGHAAAALAQPGAQLPAPQLWGDQCWAEAKLQKPTANGAQAHIQASIPNQPAPLRVPSLGGRLLLVARATQHRLQRLAAHQHRLVCKKQEAGGC